jgi:hypothetical protein
MLWRRSPQTLTIPPAAPVPEAEALRRAALQASWRRDRWVARRRVWLRWLLWVSGRYLMPALLVFGLGAWLWLGVLPDIGPPLDRLAARQKADAVQTVVAPPAPVPATEPPPLASEPQAVTFSPEGEELPVPLALRFEPRWGAAVTGGTPSTAAPAAPDPSNPTHLKPENWLHSKEP